MVGAPRATNLAGSIRLAKLHGEHLRLLINSLAHNIQWRDREAKAKCIHKAVQAALAMIRAHVESSETDMSLSFAPDVSGSNS